MVLQCLPKQKHLGLVTLTSQLSQTFSVEVVFVMKSDLKGGVRDDKESDRICEAA